MSKARGHNFSFTLFASKTFFMLAWKRKDTQMHTHAAKNFGKPTRVCECHESISLASRVISCNNNNTKNKRPIAASFPRAYYLRVVLVCTLSEVSKALRLFFPYCKRVVSVTHILVVVVLVYYNDSNRNV